MKTKSLNQTLSFVVILAIALMLGGCSQPQKKPDQTPTVPQQQTNMMDQSGQLPTSPQQPTSMMGDPSTMMRDNPDAMQKTMSAPENRPTMIKMMSSTQMRPVMMDMMKDPAMAKTMTDIMADPSMKDTFTTMVKDPRLAPMAREALKQ